MNNELSELLEHCVKCSICQSACPVAAYAPQFPGPKLLGPDTARIRSAGRGEVVKYMSLCSGCRRCEAACPCGVPVAQLIRQNSGLPSGKSCLRDKMLAYPHLLGRLGSALAPLTNAALKNAALRRIVNRMLGVNLEQPFSFASRKELLQPNLEQGGAQVIYFPGCHVNYQQPEVGKAFLQLLELLGVKALVSPRICCGMPLLAAGKREEAHQAFKHNINYFKDYIDQGYKIVTACPSCGLALKKIYLEELGPGVAQLLAGAAYDYSEYLEPYRGRLKDLANPLQERMVYHLPCHTQAQGTGVAGLSLLRAIPGLEPDVVEGCCGQSGTYGFKAENRGVSLAVSRSLERRLLAINPALIITPCGSCSDRISFKTGLRTAHPVQILLAAVLGSV